VCVCVRVCVRMHVCVRACMCMCECVLFSDRWVIRCTNPVVLSSLLLLNACVKLITLAIVFMRIMHCMVLSSPVCPHLVRFLVVAVKLTDKMISHCH
jgi:hypothetical protein